MRSHGSRHSAKKVNGTLLFALFICTGLPWVCLWVFCDCDFAIIPSYQVFSTTIIHLLYIRSICVLHWHQWGFPSCFLILADAIFFRHWILLFFVGCWATAGAVHLAFSQLPYSIGGFCQRRHDFQSHSSSRVLAKKFLTLAHFFRAQLIGFDSWQDGNDAFALWFFG